MNDIFLIPQDGAPGAKGDTGDTGATGATGAVGPNEVTASTSSSLVGILQADGANIGTVTIGTGLSYSGGTLSASGGGGAWGSITGTLSAQTDLQSALDAKASLSGATFTGTINATTIARTAAALELGTASQGVTLNGNVRSGRTDDIFSTFAMVRNNVVLGGFSTAFSQFQIFGGSNDALSHFVINSTGNVGIGTQGFSPATRLHLYQNNSNVTGDVGQIIEQAGTGDCVIQLLLTATRRWVLGVDNSDSDSFKISSTADVGAGAEFTITTSGQILLTGPLSVGVYTFATVPSASANTGAIIRISDRAQRQAYSDGTNWRFTADDAIIS